MTKQALPIVLRNVNTSGFSSHKPVSSPYLITLYFLLPRSVDFTLPPAGDPSRESDHLLVSGAKRRLDLLQRLRPIGHNQAGIELIHLALLFDEWLSSLRQRLIFLHPQLVPGRQMGQDVFDGPRSYGALGSQLGFREVDKPRLEPVVAGADVSQQGAFFQWVFGSVSNFAKAADAANLAAMELKPVAPALQYGTSIGLVLESGPFRHTTWPADKRSNNQDRA
jgi:hypothetical protein